MSDKNTNDFIDAFYKFRNISKRFGDIVSVVVDHNLYDYLRFIESQDLTKSHTSYKYEKDQVVLFGVNFSREDYRIAKLEAENKELKEREKKLIEALETWHGSTQSPVARHYLKVLGIKQENKE